MGPRSRPTMASDARPVAASIQGSSIGGALPSPGATAGRGRGSDSTVVPSAVAAPMMSDSGCGAGRLPDRRLLEHVVGLALGMVLRGQLGFDRREHRMVRWGAGPSNQRTTRIVPWSHAL